MAKRRLPEVNSGSMADIAFQLLIFFIITTTMDTDAGLFRKLPPMPENNEIEQQEVKDRNVFVVLVNKENQLLVENELVDIRDLRIRAKEFIENPNNDDNLPERIVTEIDYFGAIPITKFHVISLQNDRGTSYKTYLAVQNELTAAYNELRNELAMRKFKMAYDDFKGEEGEEDPRKTAIDEVYPLRISEAEPRNIGGN
ncbi:MAG: biopolymer transporter ExbD [Bacteroidales bacterium]|nr:biopolymer transporter ExbD [Bacteroidales bacterium]